MPDRKSPQVRLYSRLRAGVLALLAKEPVLGPFARRASLILHGSLTMGVRDRHADIDVWMLLARKDIVRLAKKTPMRFFELTVDGRPGHVSIRSFEETELRVQGSDLGGFWDTVSQLRRSVVLADPSGRARRLVNRARRPMRDAVRKAMFFHHYVEMRGEARSLDNPIIRGHRIPALIAFGKTIGHALRAAMVIDGFPPPYDKWLAHDAKGTPTGRRVERHVQRALRHIESGALRIRHGGHRHPVERELRKIRAIMIAEANRRGIRDFWLNEWYKAIEPAREVVRDLRW